MKPVFVFGAKLDLPLAEKLNNQNAPDFTGDFGCKQPPGFSWLIFREDLKYWVETDHKTALRIFQLIESVMRDPFQGIGKPELLKFLGSGVWSRRITQEHRLSSCATSSPKGFS